MAIKKFTSKSEYNSATKSQTESTVSLVEAGNEVIIDGINVRTKEPVLGDAVYKDGDGNVIYIKMESLKSNLIPQGWSYIGYVIENRPDGVLIGYSGTTTKKFLGVCEYVLDITSDINGDASNFTKTIGLRFGVPNWDTTQTITFESTRDYQAARSALETALQTWLQANAPAQTSQWSVSASSSGGHYYLIIRRTACDDYRFYNCTGCTHDSWQGMPESSSYMKVNGQTTNYRGLQNIARGKAYWSTNGRTPTASVNVGSEAGNTDPISLDAFTNSNYCNKLRTYYGSYEAYLKGEFGIDYKQKYGCFGLPTGEELTKTYGPMKVGTTPRYPALNWAYELDLGVAGMQKGDWHLWDVREGTIIMKDENLARIDQCLTKAGAATLGNSTNRWFAQRYNVNIAWYFIGTSGYLGSYNVSSAHQVGAVTLLKK